MWTDRAQILEIFFIMQNFILKSELFIDCQWFHHLITAICLYFERKRDLHFGVVKQPQTIHSLRHCHEVDKMSNQSAVTYYIIYAFHTFKQTAEVQMFSSVSSVVRMWSVEICVSVHFISFVLWCAHCVCVLRLVHFCEHTLPSSVQTIVILNPIKIICQEQ